MGTSLPRKFRRVADELMERFPDYFSDDFEKNKDALRRLGLYPQQMTKQVRNWIAGYITRRMKRARKKK